MASEALQTARRLIYLLERLSVDSHWAHRASGLRGALIRTLIEAESCSDNNPSTSESEMETRLDGLIQAGYQVLYRAAYDIRTPELQQWLQDYSAAGK